MIAQNSTGTPISQGFIGATTATRRRACARVDILWTDTNIDPLLSIESDFNNYGTQSSVDHGTDILKQLIDDIDRPTAKYIILDGTWELGDDKVLGPYTQEEVYSYQIGWYSSNMSDANGNFASPYPSVTINFNTVRTVSNIRVVGDSLLNQYPVNFTVNVYDSDDEVLFTRTVTNNPGVFWITPVSNVTDAAKLELIITKWSTPSTVAKILEFFSVERDSFEGDDIVSLDLLEEREAKSGSSPIGNVSLNELTLKLQNIKITASDGLIYVNPFTVGNSENNRFYNFLRPNRRIDAFLGFYVGANKELVKVGTFWTKGDWRCNEKDFSATVTAHDRLSLLKNHTFRCPEISTGTMNLTLKQAAELVLNHAKENIPMRDLVWDVGDDLNFFSVPILWFDKGSYFDAIKAIAEACMGYAWMTKGDALCMRTYLTNTGSVDLAITRNDYFDKDQPSNVNEMKNYVEVEIKSVSRVDAVKTAVYDDSTIFTVSANSYLDVELKYKNAPVESATAELTAPQTGLSISTSESQFMSYGCILRLRNSTGGALSSAILVNAYEYENDSSVVESAQDANLILEYGQKEQKLSNHLIQSSAMAKLIAETLVENYAVFRRDVNLDWCGDPRIEVDDVISVPEYQSSTANFVVTKNDWSFDGGLRCKTLARKVLE